MQFNTEQMYQRAFLYFVNKGIDDSIKLIEAWSTNHPNNVFFFHFLYNFVDSFANVLFKKKMRIIS